MDYSEYTHAELAEMLEQKTAEKKELQADFDTVATSIIKLCDNLGIVESIKAGKDISISKVMFKVTTGGGNPMQPLSSITPIMLKYENRYSNILS